MANAPGLEEATGRFIQGLDGLGECANAANGYQICTLDDQVFVVWVRRTVGGGENPTYEFDIMFRRRDASGFWQSPVAVANEIGVVEDMPVIAASSDQTIHVLYRLKTFVPDSTEICHRYSVAYNYGASWSNSANPVSDPEDDAWIGAAGPSKGLFPSIGIDDSQNVWAVWHNTARATGLNDTGKLFYSMLTPSAFALGDWLPQQQLSTSSYDRWQYDTDPMPPLICNASGCFWRPTYATGPEQNEFVISGSKMFFVFKDDPYQYIGADLFTSDANGNLTSSIPDERVCNDARDEVFYKQGEWNPTLGRIVWWGDQSFVQGTDIRAGYRPDETDPGGAECENPFAPDAPSSFTQLVGHQQIYSTRPGPTIARTPNGKVFTMWDNDTPYGLDQDSGLRGQDVWVREWLPAGGTDGIVKQADLNCVTRSPKTAANVSPAQYLDPRAAVDESGWIHVTCPRMYTGVAGTPYPEDPLATCSISQTLSFWQNPALQVQYATHFQNDTPDKWGWEYPITEGLSGSAYASIATSSNGHVHVLCTQYNAVGDGTLDVVYREAVPTGDSVLSGQIVTWVGTIFLDADFVVEAGGTLIITPGTIVYVQANYDRANQNVPELVEIIVRGSIVAGNAVGAPVVFQSTRRADPGPQSHQGGDREWGGIVFDKAATVMSGPGGQTVYGTDSRIENATISNATVGIGIRNTGAPSIVGTTFSLIANDFHVLVDSTDVYVPYLGAWTFEPSTHVKLRRATRAGQDITAGSQTLDAGKVNVVVHGGLNANGVLDGLVYFEPDVVPTVATVGDEWGGILFEGITLGSALSYVDIGYAIKPLTLVAQDAVIENASIHHFRDRGVWFYSYVPNSSAIGPQLRLSHVFRDAYSMATLGSGSGYEGVVMEVCPDFRVVGCQISLLGADRSTGGAGIRILNTQTFCSKTPPAGTDSAVVAVTQVSGPGGDAATESPNWRGIQSEWACGSNAARVVYIYDNQIDGWKDAAFRFTQSSDVQVSCNETMYVVRGVDFFRDDVPTGNGVRLRGNVLEVGAYGFNDDQGVVRTDDALMLKLGPALGSTPPNKGLNELTSLGLDWYAIENDSDPTKELNADDNLWTRNGTIHSAEVDILQYVTTEIAEPAHVSAAGAGPWYPLVPPCPGGSSGTVQGQGELAIEDQEGETAESLKSAVRLPGEVPNRTHLHQPYPSPFGDQTRIRFDLGGSEVREVMLEVFDIHGRLVRRLFNSQAPGGRYEVLWDGRRESSDLLASGIYFVRLTAARRSEVQKAVVLR